MDINEGNSVKTAFIAAGGPKKIKGQPKAFVDVCGKPSVERVIDSVLDSGIENVYVWTDDQERLEKIVRGKEGNVHVVDAQKKIVDSLLSTYFQHLNNNFVEFDNFKGDWREWEDVRDYIDNNKPLIEVPVLYTSGDAPLIQSSEIIKFIDGFDTKNKDFMIGFTKRGKVDERLADLLLYEEFYGLKSTINSFVYLKDDPVRINNLHVVKPLKVEAEIYKILQGLYNFRKFSSPRNWPKIIGLIRDFKAGKKKGLMGDAVKLIYSAYRSQSNKSYKSIKKHSGKLDIQRIESILEDFTGLRFQFNIEGNFGSLLDIDDMKTYKFITKNYENLSNYLSK
ncbi:NTP transferase domain-containing protein [Candidatus Woesearchaeota archaeon]|jgi:GTP:adenosylcobinamide-phosphate guanylyltransferase|nr:NTP transferase domain-containing protein [Candidatus Woesearchaeota archaeon]